MSLKARLRHLAPWLFLAYHAASAVIAALWFRFPSRSLQVFGITGTNGKTTTSHFLHSILTASRRRTGLATTVRFSDGVRMVRNDRKMTTLSAWRLQQLLRQMVQRDSKAAVLEVTSHALAQSRVWGIAFDTVIFTNLSREHIGEAYGHETFEAYQAQKERLFARPHRVSVVNADDPAAPAFRRYPASRVLAFTTRGADADVQALEIKEAAGGVQFQLRAGNETVSVSLRFPGRFNVENALAAATAAIGMNLSLEIIKEGLESVDVVPGRVESLSFGQPFRVMIDYAHSPDALKRLFEAIRPTVSGRLIHVGGATGNRDRAKRTLLGALAAQYADIIFVTNEDPDTEDPSAIIDEVSQGVIRGAGTKKRLVDGENFFRVLDRSAAIKQALRLAKRGDLVLITGKGDESAMMVNGRLRPYSDRRIVEQYLARR